MNPLGLLLATLEIRNLNFACKFIEGRLYYTLYRQNKNPGGRKS